MRGETIVTLTGSAVEVTFKDDPDYRQIMVEVFTEEPEPSTCYAFLEKEKVLALRDALDGWLKGKQ